MIGILGPGRTQMKRNVVRALAALALSIGVSQAGVAFADDTRPIKVDDLPLTKTCRSAGLPGDILEVTATVRDSTYIDITAVPTGYQLTGVMVQGVGNYNRYPWLRDMPWKDLQAPQAVPFTDWFACAKPRTSMPTPPSTSTTTTTTTTTSTSAPSNSSSSVATTTSVAPAQTDSGLAKTGFNGGWLLFIGAGLLVAGAAALILSRSRRRS
jgi:LPXTG-motif cell wall-anchored protein